MGFVMTPAPACGTPAAAAVVRGTCSRASSHPNPVFSGRTVHLQPSHGLEKISQLSLDDRSTACLEYGESNFYLLVFENSPDFDSCEQEQESSGQHNLMWIKKYVMTSRVL